MIFKQLLLITYCGVECNSNSHESDPDRLVSHIVEVIYQTEDAYLLSKRQITSFKVEKLQKNFRYGLSEDIPLAQRSRTQITIGSCVSWRHLPSSQRKSGRATSCRGISFRKPGRWQRGLPVTIFLLLSQSPSQASRQSQLKELAKRLLGEREWL